MIEIDIDSFNTQFERSMISGLIDISEYLQSKKGRGIEYEFASVVVNANIAEYILFQLITIFSAEVRNTCQARHSKVSLEVIDPKEKSNSMKIEILSYFSFKNKQEIMRLLKSIRNSRNNLFHNLVRSNTKKINIGKAIENINKDTTQLRILVCQTLKDK